MAVDRDFDQTVEDFNKDEEKKQPVENPKKPSVWSRIGNAFGTAIGEWFASRQ